MMTATKTRKATHYGECQCCGRKQKLPNGRLSLHGYTKQWGFFNGTCIGAGHLPYEQDKSMVEQALERATKQLATIEQTIADLRSNSNPEDVRHEVRLPAGRGRSAYFVKMGRVESKEMSSTDGDYKWLAFTFVFDDCGEEKRVGIESYSVGYAKTLADVAAKLNTGHADKLERNTASHLRNYIVWTTKRIAEWQPRELTPVE